MATLPTGTVTYLMTDVVGSTELWERDAEAMSKSMRIHDELAVRSARQNDGHLLKERGEGDSLFMVFGHPTAALRTALDIQLALKAQEWPNTSGIRVRMALHTGSSEMRDGDYYGPVVNRCARLRAIASSGQILISTATRQLVLDGLPNGSTLRDLGEHRLRDLLRAERVYELVHPELEPSSAPLASLNRFRHNLPIQLTSFVGRRADVAAVSGLLQSERLVTLTGSGGCGKTRLALQVAGETCESFRDGVWFIDLAAVSEGSRCAAVVAKTLGLQDHDQISVLEILKDALRNSELLLILDNCEHVIDACADMSSELLLACPELKILATSRESLRVQGEVRWVVPSMSVPPKGGYFGEIAASDAVQLFCERSSSRVQGFKLRSDNASDVGELCRLLEGIPLAIEQAASHAALLSPHQMLSRFKDQLRHLKTSDRGVEARHRTLRATIDWSYNMLSEEQQMLLCRCAVFRGSWTLEAAEEICAGADLARELVDTATQDLIDKSLIFLEEGSGAELRFRMLQAIRDYAFATGADLTATQQSHSRFFGGNAIAKAAEQEHEWCMLELPNLCAALDWLLMEQPRSAWALAYGLRTFWLRAGLYRLGCEYIERSLHWHDDEPTMAAGLNVLGVMKMRLGRLDEAREDLEHSLRLWSRMEDERQQAGVLVNLGMTCAQVGLASEAQQFIDQSCGLYERLQDLPGAAQGQLNLGRVLIDCRNLEQSVEASTKAIQLLNECNDSGRLCTAYVNRALARLLNERPAEAVADLSSCLELLRSVRNNSALVLALAVLANLHKCFGNVVEAARYADDCRALAESAGDQLSPLVLDLLSSNPGGTTVRDAGVGTFIIAEQALNSCHDLTKSLQKA